MQQNQVAEISDVKHPGYSKTAGEVFVFIFLTHNIKFEAANYFFIDLNKKSCSIVIPVISHIWNRIYIAHETSVSD